MKVGDKFYLRCRFGSSGEVAVTKVGRLWAYLSNGKRVNLLSRQVYEGSYLTADRLYANQKEYEETVALFQAWQRLQSVMRSAHMPDGMTIERINEIERLLK